MYDVFGKYGAIRQIRLGTAPRTRGTAYVVYEDIFDAKNACEHLNGFQVGGRYIVVRIPITLWCMQAPPGFALFYSSDQAYT